MQDAELNALRGVATSHPDLADRIRRLIPRLRDMGPVTASDTADLEYHLGQLVESKAASQAEVDNAGQDPKALSRLAHRALSRALRIADREGVPAVETGNGVVGLAYVLGTGFHPDPRALMEVFSQADSRDEVDLRDQAAWLASRRGTAFLIRELSKSLTDSPEQTVRFLEGVVDSWGQNPYRGAPLAGPTTQPRFDLPRPKAPRWANQNSGLRSAATSPLAWLQHKVSSVASRSPRAPDPADSETDLLLEYRVGPPAKKAAVKKAPAKKAAPVMKAPAKKAAQHDSIMTVDTDAAEAQVSTGFCTKAGERGLPRNMPLATGTCYWFFVGIGPEFDSDSIDDVASAQPLPRLPRGSELQVAVYGPPGQLETQRGQDEGVLRMGPGGTASVARQPNGSLLTDRLYFPVLTPDEPGSYTMKCDILFKRTLLQSRTVEVRVDATPEPANDLVLATTLDWAAAALLDSNAVDGIKGRTANITIDESADGTHDFAFFGDHEFRHHATLNGHLLAQIVEKSRASLRRASWGSDAAPTLDDFNRLQYRYREPNAELLISDLVGLARTGYGIWDLVVGQLSGEAADEFRRITRKPGKIEFANRHSFNMFMPAACLYDYPLYPEQSDLRVCEEFLQHLRSGSLLGCRCFDGECPSYADPATVCPSGFWGFRHEIGYATSLTGGSPDDAHVHATKALGDPPLLTIGVATDPDLILRAEHSEWVGSLAPETHHAADTRAELFRLFTELQPTVVYLFGHGGRMNSTPYFQVGTGDDGPIVRSSLRERANWRTTRPVVFLNGCHSAALSPDDAYNYATGFLQTAHASAVVGTSIAVFERFAVEFAQEFLTRFIAGREPLGAAMKASRLALLARMNPLGLAYISFGPLEVHITKATQSATDSVPA